MKKGILFLFPLMNFLHAQDYPYKDIVWQKSIGGNKSEYLYNAIPTPDYGFLLLGSSASQDQNRASQSKGDLNYFLWKISENGTEEWKKDFGGDKNDFLTTGALTKDGGYILAGFSYSSLSGDKSTKNYGLADYWVLKLNATGEIMWQKSFGGEGNDEVASIIQTLDGGYLVAGTSDSKKSGNKTSLGLGGKDYWILKLDASGDVVWEKTLGGSKTDELKSVIETDRGYMVFGNTNSSDGGTKSKNFDAEVMIINKSGTVEKSVRFGDDSFDLLSSVYIDKSDKTIHLLINSEMRSKKTLIINQLNQEADLLHTIRKKMSKEQSFNSFFLTKNQEYLLAGSTINLKKDDKSNTVPISNFQTEIIDKNSNTKWEKEIATNTGFNYLQSAIETRDGSIVLIGNSNAENSGEKITKAFGQQDFWIVKLGKDVKNEPKISIEAYPNPTSDFVNVVINKDFRKASGKVFNMSGQLIKEFTVTQHTTPVDLKNYITGIYLITLQVDDLQHSIKIFKK